MDEAMHNDRQDCVKVIMDLTDDGTEGDDVVVEEGEGGGEDDGDKGNDDDDDDMETE